MTRHWLAAPLKSTAQPQPGWRELGGLAMVELGDMAPGDAITIVYDYDVIADDLAREPIINVATANGTMEPTPDYPDGEVLEVSDIAIVTVEDIPAWRSGHRPGQTGRERDTRRHAGRSGRRAAGRYLPLHGNDYQHGNGRPERSGCNR